MPSSAPAGAAQLMRKALRTPASAMPRRAVQVAPQGIVRAIVSVTGVVDAVNDLIVPGAYAVTLKKRRPKVVDDHEWGRKAGRVLHIEEWLPGDKRLPKRTKDGQPWPLEAGALVATIQYALDIEDGLKSYQWVKFYADSNEAEFSVGYKVPPGKARKRHDGVRVILEVDLFELSHVLFGAAPLSMALEVKGIHGGTAGEATVPALGEDEEVEPINPDKPWDDTDEKRAKAKMECKTAAAVLADALGVPMLEVKQAKMRGSYEERIRLIETSALDVLNTGGGRCYQWVSAIATYDHEAIVTAYPAGDCGCEETSYVIPTNFDPVRGTVELGEAAEVELSLVAAAAKDNLAADEPPADEPSIAEPGGFLAVVRNTFDRMEGKAALAEARALVARLESKGANTGDSPEGEVVGPLYSADDLPDGDFDLYSKTEPIEAIRLEGAFTVDTREGRVVTEDGWLALDAGGFPYPIAAEEFDEVYVPYEASVETPSPAEDLETKEPVDEEPTHAPEGDEGDDEEMVSIDPDQHFADMAELHADDAPDDAPEDDEAA